MARCDARITVPNEYRAVGSLGEAEPWHRRHCRAGAANVSRFRHTRRNHYRSNTYPYASPLRPASGAPPRGRRDNGTRRGRGRRRVRGPGAWMQADTYALPSEIAFTQMRWARMPSDHGTPFHLVERVPVTPMELVRSLSVAVRCWWNNKQWSWIIPLELLACRLPMRMNIRRLCRRRQRLSRCGRQYFRLRGLARGCCLRLKQSPRKCSPSLIVR